LAMMVVVWISLRSAVIFVSSQVTLLM
jgi:hypothetical protein